MIGENKEPSANSGLGVDGAKSAYATPLLREYGSVGQLTQNGAGTGTDGGSTAGMTMQSDRNLKQNIVRVGTHHFGIGLYLFDYKTEIAPSAGYGRQFGVMADEVETVMPEAVVIHPDGYKRVNYAMLGIELPGRSVH